ncbi:probable methyltransferase-like protein 15 homolog [Contarinia nasturtii]|uniref:probable methyltransferase-like protein 15 homolog n=1 Tax=Contarinia nasturtii TaxID=265458 RepID=UPI0012D3DA64|nr:probable methyltransferase-like protein 15 homolog [Contarinia nasturtii]
MFGRLIIRRKVSTLLFNRTFVTNVSSPSGTTNSESNVLENVVNVQPHIPVMAKEVIKALKPESDKTYIDMTFGAGGHTKKILESAPDIKVIALDRDPDARKYMDAVSGMYPNQVIPLCGRFSELPSLLDSINVHADSIDGILFDFGCSSMQFDQPERGFAISADGPLDMRMDKNRYPDEPTAADVLATIDENDLAKIIKVYGGEKKAKKIARTIIDVRHALTPIRTTWELARIVASCFDDHFHMDQMNRPMHNATKTFQALRIFVNNELNEINYGIQCAEKYLKSNGRLVTITFHSLEDTIVKRHIQGQVIQGLANSIALKYVSQLAICEKESIEKIMKSNWKPLYKHVIVPSLKEIDLNPRSRSAKLRAAIKICDENTL